MPLFTYKDCEIEYERAGQGQGLLLIHGTAQTLASSWPAVFSYFKSCRTVAAPNLSGSGQTRDKGQKLTIPFLAEQALATADQAGLDSFDVIGHSLGACVALELAASQPERVNKLVLLAGFASAADVRMQLQFNLWRELAQSDPRRLAELFLFTAYSPPFVTRFSPEEIEGIVKDIHETTDWAGALRQIELDLMVNMTGRIPQIKQPALVLGCRHDYIAPPVYAKELVKLLPKAYYQELDCGHAALDELPEYFNPLVDKFLSRAIARADAPAPEA